MRAVQFLGDRQAIVRNKPDPHPGPDQVVLKMRAVAICGSDLHRYRTPIGSQPPSDLVPGHEPCGEVLEIGPNVQGLKVGDRVLVYHRVGCGSCVECRTGQANICQNGQRSYSGFFDGADAELMLAFARNCYPIGLNNRSHDAFNHPGRPYGFEHLRGRYLSRSRTTR